MSLYPAKAVSGASGVFLYKAQETRGTYHMEQYHRAINLSDQFNWE